jgi:hypothetical protein
MFTRSASTSRRTAATVAALASFTALNPMASFAQSNIVHRHPMLSSVAAAMATHHALKVAARNRKASGRRLNWAERHPTLSALGAGVAVHHYAKHQ